MSQNHSGNSDTDEGLLSIKETSTIESAFPRNQRPIHFAFRSEIRYQKKIHENAVCALSAHFIGLFDPSKDGESFENVTMIHISSVHKMTVRENKSIVIKTDESNIAISGPNTTFFAQLLYLNYFLCYTLIDPDDEMETRTDNENLFPEIDLPISLSQIFQFYYFVVCTENEIKYNHDVVRYVHSMITTKNPILDVSLLPSSFYFGKSAKGNLLPLFDTLNSMQTVAGVSLYNFECPDVLRTFSSIISYCPSIQIVHFSNCNATDGLNELAKSAAKSKHFGVAYWDLSYNKFDNFSPFSKIIQCSDAPIVYLNLNHCDIGPEDAEKLFNTLAESNFSDQLKNLSIAKMSLSTEKSLQAFKNFMAVSNLMYLDLTSMTEEASPILKILSKESQQLDTLILNNVILDEGSIYLLLIYLRATKTLKELSLNGTDISPEIISSIILAISENESIKSMTLHLNNLNLNNKNLKIVLEAFTKGRSFGKWKSLSLASNSLNLADLERLLSVLVNFKRLHTLNLDDNFDNSMNGIGATLCQLAKFQSLVNISICGNGKKRLQSELLPLLKKLSKCGTIEELDIRNNNLKNKSLPYLASIMERCLNLSVLKCDNNGFTDIQTLIGALLEHAHNLISFNFPVADCEKLVSLNDDISRPEFVQIISELQISVVNKIRYNRKQLKLPCELPFETSHRVENLIASISKESRKKMNYKPKDMTTHSCVCDIFGIPPPFQKIGAVKVGKIEKIRVGKMKLYDIHSMSKVIVETDPIYPEFFDSPTLGMNLEETFENIVAAEKLKEKIQFGRPNDKGGRSRILETEESENKPLIQRKKKLLINEENPDEIEDEKARIQFGQTQLKEVDMATLSLQTRIFDADALDDLMNTGSDNGYFNPDVVFVKDAPPLKKRKKSGLFEKKDDGMDNNKPILQQTKQKEIDEKQKEILDTKYAMSSSDLEHLEELKRMNLQTNTIQLTSSEEYDDHDDHNAFKPIKKSLKDPKKQNFPVGISKPPKAESKDAQTVQPKPKNAGFDMTDSDSSNEFNYDKNNKKRNNHNNVNNINNVVNDDFGNENKKEKNGIINKRVTKIPPKFQHLSSDDNENNDFAPKKPSLQKPKRSPPPPPPSSSNQRKKGIINNSNINNNNINKNNNINNNNNYNNNNNNNNNNNTTNNGNVFADTSSDNEDKKFSKDKPFIQNKPVKRQPPPQDINSKYKHDAPLPSSNSKATTAANSRRSPPTRQTANRKSPEKKKIANSPKSGVSRVSRPPHLIDAQSALDYANDLLVATEKKGSQAERKKKSKIPVSSPSKNV